MAKFRFPLDPLLRQRQREEDALKRELGALEFARREIEDRLSARQAEIAGGKASLRSALVGRLDLSTLRQQATATVAVDRLARRTVIDLAGHLQKIERARAALVEAARRRRAIEMLRERRLEEWKAARDRAETTFLDELATSRAAASSRQMVLDEDGA
ncbi:MAG: flagellar export protein FliJ [Phycisphaerae bacterium]|nr:flagellar export protein FliJ [Phycisphaerae bacterium]